jgi:nucleoid-associated protein YgaU
VRNIAIVIVGLLVVAAVALYFNRAPAPVKTALPPPVEETTPPPPAAPQKPAEEAIFPTFDVVRVAREGTGVIAGRAAPDSEVTVMSDDKVIGMVTANHNGEWVLIFQDPLKTGSQQLSLVARKNGESAVESKEIVTVSIPERNETEVARKDNGEGVVAVLQPRDGLGASKILQQPGQTTAPLDKVLTIDTLDYDSAGNAILTGRAMPTTEIRIYLDDDFLASVMTDGQGNWVYRPEKEIAAGQHMLRLDQVIAGDAVHLRIQQPFNRAEPLNTKLAQGSVEIQPGNNLWEIARRVYGAGIMYTLIFKENQDRIVDPDLIYPNQRFKLPPSTGPSGPEAQNGN